MRGFYDADPTPILTSAAPVRAPEDESPTRRETDRRDRTDHRADQRSDYGRARRPRERLVRKAWVTTNDDDGDGDDDGYHDQIGDLVPDPEVAREFRISLMDFGAGRRTKRWIFRAPISIRG